MTPKQGIGNLGGVVDVAIAVGPDRRGEVRDYAEDSDAPVPSTEPQRFGGLWRGAPPVAVVEEGEEGRSATAETETVCTIDSTPDRPIPTEPNPTQRNATQHTTQIPPKGMLRRASWYGEYGKLWIAWQRKKLARIYKAEERTVDELKSYVSFLQDSKEECRR